MADNLFAATKILFDLKEPLPVVRHFNSMIKGLLVTAALLLCNESFAQPTLAGHYIIRPTTFFRQVFAPLSGPKFYVVGSELTLNNDSSFQYTTCGNLLKGTWNSNTDSLFLKVASNEYRSDSLRMTGEKPGIGERPISFKIRNRNSDKILLDRKSGKTLELLRRMEP